MRLQKRLQTDWGCSGFFGNRHLFGTHHSLLSAHRHAGYCLNRLGNPESDGTLERSLCMQIVVVKAPKLLRGLLRMMFKMNHTES